MTSPKSELESVLRVINFVKVGVQHAEPFDADLWDLLTSMDKERPWKLVRMPTYVHNAIEFWCVQKRGMGS
jgi:hypothetical protein